MSSFTSLLVVSVMPDGKYWRLERPFTYHVGSRYSHTYIRVPRYSLTDFASVPRLFFFLPDWATYHKSAVLHDWLYRAKEIMGKPINRKKADQIFLEAMLVDWRHHRSRHAVAYLEYLAVRLFGWPAWHYRKSERAKQ